MVEKQHSIKVSHAVYVELVARQTRELTKTGERPTLDEVLRKCLLEKK